jgi:hypothetical protein
MYYLLPGGICTPDMIKPIHNELMKALGREIVLINYPEYYDRNFSISLDSYKSYFVHEVERHIEEENVFLGHSLGGYFALYLQNYFASTKNKSILLNPFLKGGENPLTLSFRRVSSIFTTRAENKDLVYPMTSIIVDFLKYWQLFINQSTAVTLKLKVDFDLCTSNPDITYAILGSRDNVIPQIDNTIRKCLSEKFVDGSHDSLVSNFSEIIKIIKSIENGK